jgi:hypothetical protein
MDQRDQELLDKQLRGINTTHRHDGVLILAVLAMFFTGMTLGGFLAGYKGTPLRVASYDVTQAISGANHAPPTWWQ